MTDSSTLRTASDAEAAGATASGRGEAAGGAERPRQSPDQVARETTEMLGETVRLRAGDFVQAVGDALRAGGRSLSEDDYRLAAGCFDGAAERVEALWDEIGGPEAGSSREAAVAGGRAVRRRVEANPALAYGAALAAGFLVGAFLRAGLDDRAEAREAGPAGGEPPVRER